MSTMQWAQANTQARETGGHDGVYPACAAWLSPERLWHAPLFLLPEWHGTGPLGPFALAFFGWVAPFTIIMTWVYNRTRENLVAAILMHDALNATVGLMALPIEDVVAGRAAADRGDTWPPRDEAG